jgi:hypothetical protein
MAQSLIDRIRNSSLKNKIFFSVTVVILLISVLIALFTRWILISTLVSELKQRGLGIGYSIAESCRGFILTKDEPQLTSLVFDARLGARKGTGRLCLYHGQTGPDPGPYLYQRVPGTDHRSQPDPTGKRPSHQVNGNGRGPGLRCGRGR